MPLLINLRRRDFSLRGARMPNCFTALVAWPAKRWLVAVSTALLTGLIISLPTAVLKNPIFGRQIAATDWSTTVIFVTAVFTGLLVATYVKIDADLAEERSLKIGGAGAFLSFLAVGCPVCNKLALIALGYSGAIKYFAPVQPFLALIGVALLLYALRKRLNNESSCQLTFTNTEK